jgi:hypothetical protein
MATKKRSSRTICPITQSPVLREDSAAQVDAIRNAFPKGIAAPALRALVAANLMNLKSLTKVTEAELSQLHGMGPKAISLLKAALKEQGLSFAK